MVLQCVKQLPATSLPQAYRSIITTTGKDLPIRTEDHRPGSACMTVENSEALAVAYLPQAYRSIITTTGKDLPIRTEGHRVDPIGMSPKGVKWETTCSMPDSGLTRRRSCCQQVSLWAKHYTKNTAEGIGKRRACQISI